MSTPSKEEFYQSLNEDTCCGYTWCRRLYGYQYVEQEFLDRIFARLDELNRGKVKYIYAAYLKFQIAYEIEQEQQAGTWLVGQIDKNYERKVTETEWRKKKRQISSNQALNAIMGWK